MTDDDARRRRDYVLTAPEEPGTVRGRQHRRDERAAEDRIELERGHGHHCDDGIERQQRDVLRERNGAVGRLHRPGRRQKHPKQQQEPRPERLRRRHHRARTYQAQDEGGCTDEADGLRHGAEPAERRQRIERHDEHVGAEREDERPAQGRVRAERGERDGDAGFRRKDPPACEHAGAHERRAERPRGDCGQHQTTPLPDPRHPCEPAAWAIPRKRALRPMRPGRCGPRRRHATGKRCAGKERH